MTTQLETMYKISPNSNLMYLPRFYKLPEKLVSRQPAYLKIPQKVREVLSTEEAANLVDSDKFLELVRDCYALVIWQCIQVPDKSGNFRPIPGKWGCYSGHFPLWQLSYHIVNELIRKMDTLVHWNLQALFYFKKDEEIPWLRILLRQWSQIFSLLARQYAQ